MSLACGWLPRTWDKYIVTGVLKFCQIKSRYISTTVAMTVIIGDGDRNKVARENILLLTLLEMTLQLRGYSQVM